MRLNRVGCTVLSGLVVRTVDLGRCTVMRVGDLGLGSEDENFR